MYEKITPVTLERSASSLFNNLDILPRSSEGKSSPMQKASFLAIHKHDAHITNQHNASFTHKQVSPKEGTTQSNTFLFESKWCKLEKQTVLVMAHSKGFQIFDEPGSVLLFWHSTLERGVLSEGKDAYCRGIGSVGDNILIGTCHGKIIVVETTEMNTFSIAETVNAHRHPLVTITTRVTSESEKVNVASADDEGSISLWKMNDKLSFLAQITGPTSKYPCTSLCFLKDGLLGASYYTGHIRLFDLETQRIKVEIAAHGAPVTSMDSIIMKDHSLMISGSEDTFVRVWKVKKKDKLQVTQPWFTCISDRQICGVRFNGTDQLFGVTAYDSTEVTLFKKQ